MLYSAVPTPYHERTIRFLEVRFIAGYYLKIYTFSPEGRQPDRSPFEAGMCLVPQMLPQPALTEGKYGLGFVIWSREQQEDYLLLHWWDSVHGLFHRVCVTPQGEPDCWEWVTPQSAAWVWNLDIIGFERDAYVQTILSRADNPDMEAYLKQNLKAPVRVITPPSIVSLLRPASSPALCAVP